MDTSLNLILAVLRVLVAIPLLMQIRLGVIYRRTLDADGCIHWANFVSPGIALLAITAGPRLA